MARPIAIAIAFRRIPDVQGFLGGRKRDFGRVFDLFGIVRHVQSEPSFYFLRTRLILRRLSQAASKRQTGLIPSGVQARPSIALSATSANILLAERCE